LGFNRNKPDSFEKKWYIVFYDPNEFTNLWNEYEQFEEE